ncbi:MAG: fasciclin domain-containing protein [Capsulimonadaceae bacterium]
MRQLNCTAAAVIVGMTAMVAHPARADVMTNTTSSTTVTTAFNPVWIPVITPPQAGPDGQPIDYTILANPVLDYTDIQQASMEGYTDSEIATMAKIAYLSGQRLDTILDFVRDGMTFGDIADKYGLSYYDVRRNREWKDRIREYRVAYETSGTGDVRMMVAASRQVYFSGDQSSAPESPDSLAGIVDNAPELSTFARLLHQARLAEFLRGPGPLTVFAPTNAAFDKLSLNQLQALTNDPSALTKVIDYHIIPSRMSSADVLAMPSPMTPATLEGDPLSVSGSTGSLTVNGAMVTDADVYATNGVIHEIDTVLIPPTVESVMTTTTNMNSAPAVPNSSDTGSTAPPAAAPPVNPNGNAVPASPDASPSPTAAPPAAQ